MQFAAAINLVKQYPVYSVLICFGISLLALLFMIILSIKNRGLKKRLSRLEASELALKSLEDLDPQHIAEKLERMNKKFSSVLRHVGMVRFNAFENVGNGLSFSLAVLDDNADGFVISSLFGGEETRTYAKQITGGKSSHQLSSEEVEAIKKAMEV